jgi:Tfp pilus assembly protein PilN
MRAVNLIPADDAGGRRATGSGFASYALLGILTVLIAMSATYALATRTVRDRERELADVTAQADASEAKAASLKDYAAFSNMRKARVETVTNLADSRFDWASALRDVSRALPQPTWITSLRATVSPAVTVDGAGDSLRASLAVPAVELVGCAKDQSGVATTVVALRAMPGVQRVSLSKSAKAEGSSSGSGDSAGSDTNCGSRPQFSLTIFYKAPAAATPAAGSSTTTSPGATTP